jgi:asparagine synthase (glutamine-hydrolysing)
MIPVYIGEQRLWSSYALPDRQGELWFKGYLHGLTAAALLSKIVMLNRQQLRDFLPTLDGHFALIVQTPAWTLLAADKLCSIPLFYLRHRENWFVSAHAPYLADLAGLGTQDVDRNAALNIAMAGYTVGATTLYAPLAILQAGEAVLFNADSMPERFVYYRYAAWNIGAMDDAAYLAESAAVTLRVLQKMLAGAGVRQIVIPLSAGNDSRLIASGLKRLGAGNVKCFTYGVAGNFEAQISRQVAEKLGYPWRFVALSHCGERRFYQSDAFKRYWREADNCNAVPYIQGLSALHYLKESGWIDADAVFVNGNTGDFISGGHIPQAMHDSLSGLTKDRHIERLIDAFLKKHFSLWENLKTEANLDTVKTQLRAEIARLDCENIPGEAMHGVYEYLELLHRQSKYILGNQRIYEFYGYEWRLPLWDDEYLRFWAKVPLHLKAGQHLYKNMLKRQNWGGVWDNSIPVNKQTIRPKWLIPLRFLAKCCFAPFGGKGRKAWKRFELNAFYYWRDLGLTVALFPYRQVLFDRKGARHVVAFMAERYLQEKLISITKDEQ